MKNKFSIGQKVIATGSYNWLLTKGKEYIVTKFEPESYTDIFTWPDYVTVIGDNGKPVTGHAHRFKPIESI